MEAPAPPTPSRRSWRRRLTRPLLLIVFLYGLGCSGLYFGQDAILFPGHRTQGTADAAKMSSPGVERVTLAAADGTPIVARFRAADAAHAPTVLFCYGNAMCAAWCDDIVDLLHGLGCNVLIADYLGYGESGGTPSEANCYATADAAWSYLHARPGIDADRIVVMGWSLGSAVALDLASRQPAAGLITLSAFTSVPDVARANYPLVPTGSLVRSKFDNLSKVPSVHCPVLLVHGRRDTLIAPANADRLKAAFGDQAELLWLDTADHNTMFEADPATLSAAIRGLIIRAVPATTSPTTGPVKSLKITLPANALLNSRRD